MVRDHREETELSYLDLEITFPKELCKAHLDSQYKNMCYWGEIQ